MANETLAACLADIKANPGRFYVYVLSAPAGIPVYVGCGAVRKIGQQRIAFHESQAKSGASGHKCNAIRLIWRRGGTVRYSIDSWHASEAEMFAREIALIASIGRADLKRGPLTNWSDGGEGLINRSAEVRAKASASMTRRITSEWRLQKSALAKADWASPEGRAKRLAANATNETKARKSAAATEANNRPEVLLKKKKQMAVLWQDPAYRQKQSEALRAAASAEGYRRLRGEQTKARWADPAYRERLRQSHLRRWADKEHRERISQAIKANSQKPEYKKKMAVAMREERRRRWADPEFRRKIIAARWK